MPITSDDLNAFHRFAIARVAKDGAESLQELVTLWEIDHPDAHAHAQNVAAVQAAIRDMEEGDQGRSAVDILQELRSEMALRRTR